MNKVAIFIFTIILTQQSFAYKPQDGNVSATVGPFLYKTNFGRSGVDSPSGSGFGIIAQGDTSDHGGLEISVFTMNKNYLVKQEGGFLHESTSLLQIDFGYRHWFDERFSGSVSFFSAYAMGNPQVIRSDFGPSYGLNTSAHDRTDYGFDFSLAANLVEWGPYALAVDARYAVSVTAKEHEWADDYGILLGVRYLILSK